ncbi:MAG: NAD(P)-dependent oxidoreductase [Planctomycetes bacterium]|nr:NAD(P)-dependent oxidoreductase [Planctomycetota bacterium]
MVFSSRAEGAKTIVEQPSVGLIGIGIMGEPMARNLLHAGYTVHLHSRTQSRTRALCDEGALWQPTPAAIAQKADVIISIVSDSPDVKAVYLDPNGVCSALRENTLCIDMSTIAPDVARCVATEVHKRGSRFLDAPVSGGKTGAETGQLSIMVGGDAADVRRAAPIFDVLGKSTVHCGPVGHGQLTKLCNQILCGLNLLAVSEAMVFARRAGLDPETMLQAVSKGAAGSWALDHLGPRMIARDFSPMFMIDLQQKDLRIALATARHNGVPIPGTALVNQLLAANQAADEGREGTQALVKTIERLANIT